MKSGPIALLVLAAGVVPGALAHAQCPDGTPPPCRVAAPVAAPAAARRPAPPIDDRTWIVVPFENVTRAADMEWLEDASVNLLYLDMSKWRDIKVIDDERVADLIRDVPETRSGTQLTLQGGLAVARLAGAGKLVMGDVLKVGSRTQLVGKVFDVKSGQRLRTVRQDAADADAIMGAFGSLARAVLNVAPPPGTSLGTIGTTSVEAYQSYILGVGYLNRWLLDSARSAFDRAIARDSTFALAHYKLGVVYGWVSPNSTEGSRHASAAARLGKNLPQRERNLLAGYAAFSANHWGEACRTFRAMVAADSSDVEAWYNLGECTYHDLAVVPQRGDSTRFEFRGSWNTSLRAFRKVLELDPTYHLAFQHIQDALLAPVRQGCRSTSGDDTCSPVSGGYQTVVRRSGDSLLLEPVLLRDNTEAYVRQGMEARQTGVRRRSLLEARREAEAWLAAGPEGARAHLAYTRILLRAGDLAAADTMARLVSTRYTSAQENAAFLVDRIEIAIKRSDFALAARVTDSLRALTDTTRNGRNLGILVASIMGRMSGLTNVFESVQGPPWVRTYFSAMALNLLGLTSDSLLDAEATFSRNAVTQGAARASSAVAATLLFIDPRIRGGRWPVTDTANSDARIAVMSVVATGDTARIRRALVRFDSIAGSLADEPDNGFAMVGALAHLAIADSAGALARLRHFRDSTFLHTTLLDQIGTGFAFAGMLWPRMFLLLGELEEAAGNRPNALAAYRRVIGFWEKGEAEVQPFVARARVGVARVGG